MCGTAFQAVVSITGKMPVPLPRPSAPRGTAFQAVVPATGETPVPRVSVATALCLLFRDFT
jgi:hypothetical protein